MRSKIAKANEMPENSPLVCIVAYDGLCTFEFGIAVELFSLPRPEFPRWYRAEVIAADDGLMRATGGIQVATDGGVDRLADADLILLPGWRGAGEPVPGPLADALIAAEARGARLATICSGVFVLAQIGLLNGRRATTHWRYAEILAGRFPEVAVDPDVLFVEDGPILTSAGSAAGLDMGLHIIRQDYGAEVANQVARRLCLPARRDGGQRQFVPMPEPVARTGGIAPLLDQIRAALDEDWPLARMAAVAGMSNRTLARRMEEATGETPKAWLRRARVARASDLLERSDLTLDDIGAVCGFGSPETFRRDFRRITGLAPSAYRARFRAVA